MLASITSAQILSTTQSALLQLRRALETCADLQSWAAGVALSDLQAAGFSEADGQAILTALADANALYSIYVTGQPPATYPQAASAYTYAASQRVVIGPQ